MKVKQILEITLSIPIAGAWLYICYLAESNTQILFDKFPALTHILQFFGLIPEEPGVDVIFSILGIVTVIFFSVACFIIILIGFSFKLINWLWNKISHTSPL